MEQENDDGGYGDDDIHFLMRIQKDLESGSIHLQSDWS